MHLWMRLAEKGGNQTESGGLVVSLQELNGQENYTTIELLCRCRSENYQQQF